jgi:hypothetical protein
VGKNLNKREKMCTKPISTKVSSMEKIETKGDKKSIKRA